MIPATQCPLGTVGEWYPEGRAFPVKVYRGLSAWVVTEHADFGSWWINAGATRQLSKTQLIKVL